MQYSLKDLFLAVTLIALGLPCFPLALHMAELSRRGELEIIALYVYLAGAISIGAGLGAIFRKKAHGAGIALVLAMAYLFLMAVRVGTS